MNREELIRLIEIARECDPTGCNSGECLCGVDEDVWGWLKPCTLDDWEMKDLLEYIDENFIGIPDV